MHPRNAGVWFQVMVGEGQVVILVHLGGAREIRFDLAAMPVGEWIQLRAPEGALPITILSQLPTAAYAAWY
jgi:hypothetical protein